jgi:7,8-dihydropterin-6-yl-methyl-4-(beta-D-ribofuranosyl)aminobenzene 5'-phosphate synthase
MENGEMLPDDFLHEQYLLLEEQGNTVLISGCSHKGILNIGEWFSPNVLVGGFHFSKLPTDNLLRGYAETLSSFDCRFYTCHCTGVPQYEFMKEFMPKLHYISTGEIVII